MKAIGPYVAARELPGGAAVGGVRTLRATDRLTGMPVLLHVLDHPPRLPELPEHPALLTHTDSGMDGQVAYVATELPPHARPADDPVLAARGALGALAALHERGLAHGGVGPAQLWSVDGEVGLAGAGLPWPGEPSPEGDLRDLAAALETLGPLPAALRPLRERGSGLNARGALDLLGRGGTAPAVTPPAEEARPISPTPEAKPAHRLRPTPLPEPAPQRAPTTPPAVVAPTRAEPAPPLAPEPAPHDGTTIVLGPPAPPAQVGGAATTETTPAESMPASATSSPSPSSSAPAGRESPQERRRRENEARREQAMQDARAAADRKMRALREAATTPPEPIRIGFGDAVDDDLPPMPERPEGSAPTPASPLPARTVERLPASLRRPEPPAPEEVSAEPEVLLDAPPREGSSGRLPGRHVAGAPIRIGWDEDDSWRVVRAVPAPPPRARPRLPQWAIPALIGVALVGALALLVPRPAAPPPCCEVNFTLRGVPGVTARLSVREAPPAARLAAGQELGTVPGKVRLPAPGRYRLRVSAEGYTPGELDLSVPRTGPVNIDLGE